MNRFWNQALATVVAVVAFAAVTPAQAGFISTVPSWNTFQGGYGFGDPPTGTATYGQTITVDPLLGTFLTDFSFRVATNVGETSRFQAIVMEWNSVAKVAVGPILFNSPSLTNVSGDTLTYNVVNVTTNVQLVANKEYVLFFTTTNNVSDGISDYAFFGAIAPDAPDTYIGGSFVYNDNGTNFGNLSSNPWTNYRDFDPTADDLAFTANFGDAPVNPTPAPAGVVLFGVGFAGLGMFRSFRKSKTVA